MRPFDDPLFRFLADRALEVINDDTLGGTPSAT